ncbi:MAG: VWA domain-containing protein [Vicinamibacteria bacterium]|nr:VWA domain-containing protein [Vicinamibacteria bacterium]
MIRSRRPLALLLLPLAAAALAAAQAPSQAPVPTFKSEVNYIEVDVRVTDERGQFVRDLRPEDFQILEDGKPQAVAAFSFVDIPVEKTETGLPGIVNAPPPDVRSNLRPFDGRIYVMVIDENHTRFNRTARARKAARQFIEKQLGANDLMAVVHTFGSRDSNQEFTSDKQLLLAAVDRTAGRAMRSTTASRLDEYNNTREFREPDTRVEDPNEAERAHTARNTLDTLRSVAEFLASVRGRRKAILFLSEGIGYDFYDMFNNRSASIVLDEMRDTIAAAARSNVAFYGIDPRGLTSLGDEDIEIGSYPDDPSLGLSSTSLMDELRLQHQSLQVLAEDTGGFAVINQNDFTGAFDRIVRENSSYYVLAYDPPDHKRDGKFHAIEVKVNRPGLKVQARKGYASPRGKAPEPPKPTGTSSAEVQAALHSPLPASGLTLTVFAAPFRGTGGKASVLLGTEVRGRDMNLDGAGKLELSSMAIDAKGEIRGGTTESVSLALKPETRARIAQTGLRVLSRFDLPPGRHQLRVAGHDAGNGRTGSVILDLTIPNFEKESLSISGVALTSAMSLALPTARPDALLSAVLPGSPVATREFLRNDQAMAYAEIYDTEKAPHTIEVTTTVTNLEDGSVVLRSTEEHASASMKERKVGVTVNLPLPDLADGTYVLKIAARSRRDKAEAVREVPFTVVGLAPGARTPK